MKSSLLSVIENNFVKAPDSVAVTDVKGTVRTYGELQPRIKRIQNLFPIDEPSVIGIYLDYDVNLIETLLAVIMSGATAVVADLTLNKNEIKSKFLQKGVEFVITTPKNAGLLSGFLQVHFSETAVRRASEICLVDEINNGARAIHLSEGALTHADIQRISERFVRSAAVNARDVVLQASRPGSKGFVREIFGTLITGGCLAVLPKEADSDARKLLEYAEAEGVTLLPASQWLMEEILSRRLSKSKLIRLHIETSENISNQKFGSLRIGERL